MALLLKTNHQILIALFLSFKTICVIASLRLTGIEEQLDCKSIYDNANKTISGLGPNWRDELEKQRKNFTEEVTQCKQNVGLIFSLIRI